VCTGRGGKRGEMRNRERQTDRERERSWIRSDRQACGLEMIQSVWSEGRWRGGRKEWQKERWEVCTRIRGGKRRRKEGEREEEKKRKTGRGKEREEKKKSESERDKEKVMYRNECKKRIQKRQAYRASSSRSPNSASNEHKP
jgi:hypothetical protein